MVMIKLYSLSVGHYLEGVAWFWKFKCEHRLVQMQVNTAIEAAGEEKVLVRKEKEGFQGQEVKEPEPTPAYPGLELSVQLRLVAMLEKAEKVWETTKFSPSEWMDAR